MIGHIIHTLQTVVLPSRITPVCKRFPPDFVSKCITTSNLDIVRIHINKLDPFQVIDAALTHQEYSLLSLYTDMSLYKSLWGRMISDIKILESVLLHVPSTFIKPLFRKAARDNNLPAVEFLCRNYGIIINEGDPLQYSIKHCRVSVTRLLLKYFTPTSKHIGYQSFSHYYIPPHILVSANPRLIRYYYPHMLGILSVILSIVITYIIISVVT